MGDAQPLTEAETAAFLRERAGYLQNGNPDRAAQVDAYLKSRGYEPEAEPRRTPPQGRTARPPQQKTAD